MNYEKEYNAIVQRCRELHESGNALTKQQMEIICPQLKESEDERIRKVLLNYHKNAPEQYTCGGLTNAEVVAWLEKQKEQKPAVEQLGGTFNSYDMAKTFAGGQYYVMEHPEKFGLCKHSEWSEEDKEMLEKCISHMINIIPVPGKHGLKDMSFEKHTDDELAAWLKSLPERFNIQPKQEWSEEDEENFKWFDKFFRAESIVVGGRDIPQDKYLWFKSLRPSSKAKLTLLDENIINAAVAFVEQNDHFNYWGGIDKHTVIKALRSLKPQWKPSEEQMQGLRRGIVKADEGSDAKNAMVSLYNDLKKL